MGHCVEAFLAKRANLEAIQSKYGFSEVVDLSHGVCLLPLLDELYDAIEGSENSTLSDGRFQFLTPKIGDLLLTNSEGKGIIYFETEYFGGEGGQRAVFVKDGKVEMEPNHSSDSINQALKLLGVRASGELDEFDEVHLGWFRSNESWIEQPKYSGIANVEKIDGEKGGMFASLWKWLNSRG